VFSIAPLLRRHNFRPTSSQNIYTGK